ncbi:MAG: hypothetical protein A2Y25_03015 [Candidatus Melainabacteria bacterium GWF2_37_15]|nr:MAG: hypothetical protein A2Y25_03015 [Candidatus Melainabacteria bacterium GWF2_37_15]
MHRFKLFVTALAVAIVLLVTNTTAFAEQKIGLVDMEKVLNNYDKAKAAQADLQANQEELQKMLIDAKKQIDNAKSDKDKEKLQQEIADKITQKSKTFKENFTQKWEVVENNVLSTIKQVADSEDYTLVMDKQSVIAGGDDITDKVMSALK